MEYSDAPAVGELTVEKKGEVLDGFKGGLLASSYEKEFVYKKWLQLLKIIQVLK